MLIYSVDCEEMLGKSPMGDTREMVPKYVFIRYFPNI